MRLFAAVLAVLAIVLAVSSVLAQPPSLGPTREARSLDAGLVVVETTWRERGPRRTATITASLAGGRPITLHDGATVRTAIGGSGDALLVVAWHGGDQPFARALLASVRGGALHVGASLDLSRAIASARPSLRPASAVIAPTPEGFTIVLQEQDGASPQADVVTTMTRIGRDGTLIEAARQVVIPWAIAALGWNGAGYHLAVMWGGFDTAHAGSARICLVTLSPEGSPQQHPWWASPWDGPTEVQLVMLGAGMQMVWRRADGVTVALHDATAAGGWSVEPPEPRALTRIDATAPFAAIVRDGGMAIATP